jgi:hypothetical protein
LRSFFEDSAHGVDGRSPFVMFPFGLFQGYFRLGDCVLAALSRLLPGDLLPLALNFPTSLLLRERKGGLAV